MLQKKEWSKIQTHRNFYDGFPQHLLEHHLIARAEKDKEEIPSEQLPIILLYLKLTHMSVVITTTNFTLACFHPS